MKRSIDETAEPLSDTDVGTLTLSELHAVMAFTSMHSNWVIAPEGSEEEKTQRLYMSIYKTAQREMNRRLNQIFKVDLRLH